MATTRSNTDNQSNIYSLYTRLKLQDDWEAYTGLVEELGKTVQIVGDDLLGASTLYSHR